MALKKNVASQKWRVYAFDSTDGSAQSGDAANITGKIALDWAAAGVITDTNPTETEDGYYVFDLTQSETNADNLDIYPESSTANIIVVGSPASQSTVPMSATAYAALEDQYDGTGLSGETYPATQAQVANISTGSAAISTVPEASPGGFVITEGASEANTEDSTHSLDGVTHDIEDAAPNTDVYYIFDVGGSGVPTEVVWDGYVNSNGDDYNIYAYNWLGTAWQQIGTIPGSNGSTIIPHTWQLTTSHVGTGANLGLVHVRFYSTDGTKLATDRILCSYAVVAQSVGYSDGAIWVDSAGTAGAELYVNGTADNPCPWANALTLNSTLGLNRFHIANDVTITLDAATTDKTLFGDHWYLALAGQNINDSKFIGATITGIGSAASHVNFEDCEIGAVTMPPCVMTHCGISGQFTGASAGEYVFHQCYSMVPGSGSPAFVFSGNGASSGINNRGWHGGATYTLDSDCTMSHEVSGGGHTDITTGGADVEVRGITRQLTLACSAAETVQFVGITGDIAISGTTTATVNLYGVGDGVTDTSSAATITNKLVSLNNINTEADTALSDYNGPTDAEMVAAFTEIKGATWASGTDTLEHIRNKQTDIEADTNELVTDDVPTLIAALPTAAENRTELDSNSTQLAAIVADTNELQTDDVPTLIAALPTAIENRTEMDSNSTQLAAIVADTNELQADDVPTLIAALNDIAASDILTTALTESYAADGAAPTLAQALFAIQQFLQEKSVAGTVMSVKRLDGTSIGMTFTLDSATAPTSITRAS